MASSATEGTSNRELSDFAPSLRRVRSIYFVRNVFNEILKTFSQNCGVTARWKVAYPVGGGQAVDAKSRTAFRAEFRSTIYRDTRHSVQPAITAINARGEILPPTGGNCCEYASAPQQHAGSWLRWFTSPAAVNAGLISIKGMWRTLVRPTIHLLDGVTPPVEGFLNNYMMTFAR